MRQLPDLPVSAVLPAMAQALSEARRAVLSAPPGAGKTSLVPLHLLNAAFRGDDRILILEPRRLAARAAAARMAALLGEDVGETVGYRMRLDSRLSSRTRIEVVTEGVFARMILDDPELTGVSTVIFDEFHERSLDADFGLALALDVQRGLRDDLRILVMSATLDVARVAALLDEAPIIESMGRSFPVELRYRDRPGGERIEDSMSRAIIDAHGSEAGSILAFLPGQSEILRTADRLQGRFDETTLIVPLFGNLSQKDQDLAIRPAPDGQRKIVLATSIAETSITIDGVRMVVDSGLQRLPVYEAQVGVTRLETVRVSLASADQRAGRAGRTAPGIAIRLWHPGQNAALPAFTPPEILSSDLASLALDLAHWGVKDPATLPFLDAPPPVHLDSARSLLRQLGALDDRHDLTARGRRMRDLAVSPRLAAMILKAEETGHAKDAALLAVLLTEHGLGGQDVDLDERLRRFRQDRNERAEASRRLASRIAGKDHRKASGPVSAGALLLHAYPDRVAAQRGGRGRFLLANGRGCEIEETERLAGQQMLVVADLTGRAARSRILAAAEIDRDSLEAALPNALVSEEQLFFDRQSGQVRARAVTRYGAIILEERPRPRPMGPHVAEVLAEAIKDLGIDVLPFSKEGDQLRARLGFLARMLGDPWPQVSDEALLAKLDTWYLPFQQEAGALSEISPGGLTRGLLSLVPHDLARDLDRLAPTHFEAPTGNRHPIRYDGEEPILTIRVQELFGLKQHPTIGGKRMPLLLELTSPAHRPIQTTRDLPGFWSGSWRDVRADMRGRYPKHPWPERPEDAAPTARAKPRGT